VIIVGSGATFDPTTDGVPGFHVRGNSDVTIDGLVIRGATNTGGYGIRCESGSTLELDRSEVRANDASGVLSQSCPLTMDRDLVADNLGGGIALSDAGFRISNSIIVRNGDVGAAGSSFGGVSLFTATATAPQQFEFNTVAENQAGTAAVTNSMICSTSDPTLARGNIVYSGFGGGALVSGNCSFTFSDVDGGATGAGNIDMDPLFADAVTGDYHITETSPCRDAAGAAAAPAVDYEGDARPDGAADIGADEYVP
jgi:hypothetical protein